MASSSQQPHKDAIDRSSKAKVTILASEWGSSKGGLSTINRELAIQLAKCPEAEITFFLPQCSVEGKNEALSHNIKIVEATRRPGFEELDWLSFPPEELSVDVIVGHGVKLGHQAQIIRDSHKCRWVQVVHTDPEELGMFKSYSNPILKGEEKRSIEVELCQMADFVVGIGPKLTEAFRAYLRWCGKDQSIHDLTPGIFDEFQIVQQVSNERENCRILVFGRGDAEDFALKGFDIAGRAVASLPYAHLVFVGAPTGKHEEIAARLLECGIPRNRLKVRGYVNNRESLKRLFCEVDLVLMPSRTEGFGLAGLEALSAGLPVLVSGNSGFGQALSKVPFGSSFVIDAEEPQVWAAAIKEIWDKDRKVRLKEAEALRTSYGKEYSWTKQSKDLLQKMIDLTHDLSASCHSSVQSKGRMFPCATQASQRTGDLSVSHPDAFSDKKTSNHNKRNKFSPSQPSDEATNQHEAASYPAHIIERIRELYKIREERLLPLPWCEDFSFHLNDIFTRLKIVSKEKTRGKLTDEITDMTAIFKTHEDCKNPRMVLIEGDPGIGKTTYCQKLAYDWATKQDEWDDSFPKIEVLLLLRCHDITSNLWEAIDDQILPDDVDEGAKEGFFKFVRENQSKVLLVLDGLDEADPSKLEMYINLLESKVLPYCHILVTSRHEAGTKIRRYMDTLWEIVGFTETDAKTFIRKYFRTMGYLAEKLFERLWNGRVHSLRNPKSENLTELTTNPLNTVLLCVLCEDFEGVLPENRTALYIEIVNCVLRRFEKKNGILSSKEEPVTVYKKELVHLGCLALQSLLEGEFYIEEHQLDCSSSNLIKFGFLSIQSGGNKRKASSRYGFLHKSFQEFFAGLYLALQILNGEIDCDLVVTDERYRSELRQVFLFMSGIVASRSEDTSVSLVTSIANHVNGPNDKDTKMNLELAFDCILECNTHKEKLHPQLLHILGKNLNLKTLVIDFDYSNHYCLDLFCEALKVNTCLTNLHLKGDEIGDSGAASLSEALKVNTFLTILDFSGCGIGDSGAASLSEALKVNTCLTKLHLGANDIGDSGAASLSKALKVNTSLIKLQLDWSAIDDSGAGSLSEALKVNTCLINLDLGENDICHSGAASLSKALHVNTCLTKLNLRGNGIGDSGAASLSEALIVNTSLTKLNLFGNGIGDSGVTSLSEALKVNTCLTKLHLGGNWIGNPGAASLSEALKVNTCLIALNFGGNGIVNSGAACLAEALKVNTCLTKLNLFGNGIGDCGAASLSEALKVNTGLTKLHLSGNWIGDSGAACLSEALKVNSCLTKLDFGRNRIVDSGAAFLSDALKVNTSLAKVDLGRNGISDSGAASLSEALKVNTGLTKLHLGGNWIGDSGALSLSEALKVNTCLTNLHLRRNTIGDSGAAFLSEALKLNTCLTNLYLDGNRISDSGAAFLSKACKVNKTVEVTFAN